MPLLYFDTSALVRRYDETEPGATRVHELCVPRQDTVILIASVTSVEVASALNRKVRQLTLEPAQREFAWRLFKSHERDEYKVVLVDTDTVLMAERLVFTYPLRAYDAIQLATAVHASTTLAGNDISFRFCTADQRQAQAATGEGLQIELIA